MAFVLRNLGVCDYADTLQEMKDFTRCRNPQTADEVWLLQHNPVYTQGSSCSDRPITNTGNIPVVHSNRGGQITYHGPGQLIAYLLLDIKRRNSGPKSFVNLVEQTVIDYLADYGINSNRIAGAPGVYVKGQKIAALGLRISRGCTYHGLCINIDMDLTPFAEIDPCGYPGLEVTQLKEFCADVVFSDALLRFGERLRSIF